MKNNDHSTANTIHCLGSALVDILISPIQTYPRPKQQTSVFVDSMSTSPGGGATHSAITLAHLGGNVRLFSKIGGDYHGVYLTQILEQAGVDVSTLVSTQEQQTSTVIVGVHENGDRSFISYHGALGSFSLEDVDRESLLSASFLLYPDLFNLPRIDGLIARELFREAQLRGVTTVVDLTWGVSGLQKDLLGAMLPYIDYLLPSADELRLMYPQFTDEKIIEFLLKKGAKTVILKLGSEGVLVSNSQYSFRVPAVREQHEVVDTTGAGDNFNAGFVYGLSQGKSLEDAVAIGSTVAGVSIMRMGALLDEEALNCAMETFRW